MKGPLGALASCALIIVVFIAIDLTMRWQDDAPPVSTHSTEYMVPSDALGYAPLKSTVAHITKTKDGQVVYDVDYAFDEHARRIVPQDPNGRYDTFLLFFGDSNTFGEGLDARATLPYQTASALNDVRAYNYAFQGYGPQHILAKLQSTDLRAEVDEPRGLVLYVYLGFLMDRLLGGSRTLGWATRGLPDYTVHNGSLEREGFFQTTRPFYSVVMWVMGNSPLLQRLNVGWPWRMTDEHRELFCKVMAAARDEVRRQFSGSDFAVVLHPKASVPPFACYERYGLRIIDIRNAYGDTPRAELALPIDGHASARANELVGAALAREVEPLLAALRK
jgi:hypothetical protein